MAEVQQYEEQFAQRFSAQDEEFQRYLQQPDVQPPMVEAWRSRDTRFQDRRHHRGGSGGWGQRSEDRRYGGHQNSYNQRRHYDRY